MSLFYFLSFISLTFAGSCSDLEQICYDQCASQQTGNSLIFSFLETCQTYVDNKVIICYSPPGCNCVIPEYLRSQFTMLTSCTQRDCDVDWAKLIPSSTKWCEACADNCDGFQDNCIDPGKFCRINNRCAGLKMCERWREDSCEQGLWPEETCGVTDSPTIIPTLSPSFSPTMIPTLAPSFSPTNLPTMIPTLAPSFSPTNLPTMIPTLAPSFSPTNLPSLAPTILPTMIQTESTSSTTIPTTVTMVPTNLTSSTEILTSSTEILTSSTPSSPSPSPSPTEEINTTLIASAFTTLFNCVGCCLLILSTAICYKDCQKCMKKIEIKDNEEDLQEDYIPMNTFRERSVRGRGRGIETPNENSQDLESNEVFINQMSQIGKTDRDVIRNSLEYEQLKNDHQKYLIKRQERREERRQKRGNRSNRDLIN
jgi:hypothetical protein